MRCNTGVNICFLAIGLLLCLLATCAYAYPSRGHHRSAGHQQVQLHRRSMPMRHSRRGYNKVLYPTRRQRRRCVCTPHRRQYKNNPDMEEEMQINMTDAPINLETYPHGRTENGQRQSRHGSHIRPYGGEQRSCYCPRGRYFNLEKQEKADNVIQRHPYHRHGYANRREIEDKLEEEATDENIAATVVDSEKKHRHQRRHYGSYQHWRHGHEHDSDAESGEDVDEQAAGAPRRPWQHRHHFGRSFQHRPPSNWEFDETVNREDKDSNEAEDPNWHHHRRHHHRHPFGHNCQHKHKTDSTENAAEGETAITTTTTTTASIINSRAEEREEEATTNNNMSAVNVDRIVTTPTTVTATAATTQTTTTTTTATTITTPITTPTVDTVEENTWNTVGVDLRFGQVE